MGNISSKCRRFGNAWCNFVDVHERYWMTLHDERDRKIASASYEEQTKRKLQLDSLVNDWRDMIGLSRSEDCKKPESKKSKSERSKPERQSKCSRASSTSSNSSILSRKKEEMALAQLKLQQLKIQQIFEEKEQELKRSKQLTEAEMEITRTAVSLEIYQRAEEEKNCKSKVNQEQLLQTDLLRREEIAAGQEASRITEQSRENTNCTNREEMLAATSHERPPAHNNEIVSGLLDGTVFT